MPSHSSRPGSIEPPAPTRTVGRTRNALPSLPASEDVARAVAHSLGLEPNRLRATTRRLHARLGKRLAEYHVEDGTRGVDVICKVYREAERGYAAFDLLRALDVMRERDPSLRAVAPLAWMHEQRALIMERAPGTTLHDRLLAAPDDTTGAERAAEWLVALHRLPPPTLLPHDGRRTALRLTELAESLGAVVGAPLRGRVTEAIETIAKHTTHDASPVLLHGDFHLFNIYVGDGPTPSIVVIDVDHALIGDAAWDVAYHLGHLRATSFDQWRDFARLDRVARAFGARYASSLDAERCRALLDRVPALIALTLLESLHFRRVILRLPDHSLDRPFIDEVTSTLAREPW